jgi:predicted Zn-dependent protease
MKRLAVCLVALAGIASVQTAFPQGNDAQDDAILRAMREEVARAKNLRLENLEGPYYVEARLEDSYSYSATAMLGALVRAGGSRVRLPRVEVRVGDYKFDNTNYVGSGFSGGGGDARVPLDDSALLLRRPFWLLFDRSYKAASQAIARKRAALKNFNMAELPEDFSRAEPVKLARPRPDFRADEEIWTARVRTLSAVLQKYPAVLQSQVEMDSALGISYLVNSEGTEIREPEQFVVVRARGNSQSPDGMMQRDAVMFHAVDAAHLPGDAEMAREIGKMGERLTALAAAPFGDTYSGPVLFERDAAAQLFAHMLGKNLALLRRPVMEPGRGGGFPSNDLEGRLGSRILPEWMDVVDDPTQTEWRGGPLMGHYAVDTEGVIPKPLTLVERGVLKNYLMTRQPLRGISGSNGRARMPGSFGARQATFSNLFIRAGETVSPDALKKKLIEAVKARNKEYGILIRKLDYPTTAGVDELRRRLSSSSQSSARPAALPLLVYRVYADGREELVRGLRFRNLAVRSLKDITAASDEQWRFDLLDSNAPLALAGAGGFVTECTVVAPSVLVDDVELERIEEEFPKVPVVPPPPPS